MILPPKKQLWKWSKLAHRNHLANFTKVQSNFLIDSVAARKNTFFKIPSSLSPRTCISNSHCPTYKMSDNPKLTYFCFIQNVPLRHFLWSLCGQWDFISIINGPKWRLSLRPQFWGNKKPRFNKTNKEITNFCLIYNLFEWL